MGIESQSATPPLWKSMKRKRIFLDDLRDVFNQESGRIPSSSSFRDHLQSVYQSESLFRLPVALDEFSPAEMEFLAEQLEQWRDVSLRELSEKIKGRPEDDPLRCPISLFGILEYGRRETAHTRILSWLLDSGNEHKFGPALLLSLITILNGGNSTLTIRKADAIPEKPLSSTDDREASGRTDIWIDGTWEEKSGKGKASAFLIVIEAKIDHSLGDDQLERYDEEVEAWIKGNSPNVYRIFLTPDGRLPQSQRRNKKWKALSFLTLAAAFGKCLPSLGDKPGYHLLRFYLATIFKDILQWPLPLKLEKRNCYQALRYINLLSG